MTSCCSQCSHLPHSSPAGNVDFGGSTQQPATCRGLSEVEICTTRQARARVRLPRIYGIDSAFGSQIEVFTLNNYLNIHSHLHTYSLRTVTPSHHGLLFHQQRRHSWRLPVYGTHLHERTRAGTLPTTIRARTKWKVSTTSVAACCFVY